MDTGASVRTNKEDERQAREISMEYECKRYDDNHFRPNQLRLPWNQEYLTSNA